MAGDFPVVIDQIFLACELGEQLGWDRFLHRIRWEDTADDIALVVRVADGDVRREQWHIAPGECWFFSVMHDLADEFFPLTAGFFEVANALGQAGDRLFWCIDFHREKRLELRARLRPSEELVVGCMQPEQREDRLSGAQAHAARSGEAGQRLGDGTRRDFPFRHAGRQRLGELQDDLVVQIILLQARGDADGIRPLWQLVEDDFGQRTGVHRDAQVVLLVGREGATGVSNSLRRFF